MRIEQHQKGEGEVRTTLENLISLASRRRDFRPFENRAKTSTDRVCVFEPEAAREKARFFLVFALRPDGQSAHLCKLAALPEHLSNYVRGA
jgi:hypothetical protein